MQKTKLFQSEIEERAAFSDIRILTDFDRFLFTAWCLFQKYANKQVAKFLETPFLHKTFEWLLLQLVEQWRIWGDARSADAPPSEY